MPIYEKDMPGIQESGSSLARLILGARNTKELSAQEAQQAQALAQKKQELDLGSQKAKQAEDIGTIQKLKDLGLGGRSVKAGEIMVGEQPQPNPMQLEMAQNRRQNTNRQVITGVKSDFDKVVGKSQQQIQAAQNVQKALESGNILTLGQIKAQLPLMEGENYRPTDAERKMMLSPTGEGVGAKLKNWLGGDSAELSASQKSALYGYVQKKVAAEQDHVDRSRAEVVKRWAPQVKTMAPDEFEGLAQSLGSSSQELMGQLAGKKSASQPQAQPQAAAPAVNPARAELMRLRQLKQGGAK